MRIHLFFFLLATLFSGAAAAETRAFTATAVEIAGTKFWLPSSFTVKKGDVVKIQLATKVPGANNVHGFAIDAFKIEKVVDEKGASVEFTADKVGIFPLRCHMHPAHVGGQLIVLE